MTSFKVNGTQFLEAISSIYPLVPNKPSRDILKCFRITAKQAATDTITIRATDLETFAVVELSTGVMVFTDGEIAVPAAILIEYAKAFDGGDVDFLVTPEEALKLTESTSEFEVGLQDLDEYPDFPDMPASMTWSTVPVPALAKALSQVVFAVAEKGSPRWGTLNAICMETNDTIMTLIGTDQHRASMVEIELTDTLAEESYLLPSKTLALVPKIFTEDEVEVSFDVSNNIIFKDESTTIMVRLMHGNFPPVKTFMPTHPNKLELNAPDFLKRVRKSALATDKHSTLRVELSADKIKLLTKTRQQRKVAKIEYPVPYDGNDFQFAVNCKYIIDMLKASTSDEAVEMHFNQNNQPILFTQSNFKHLVVPQEVR
jgi:DNA polymerase-3 subunit beta